VNCDEARPLIHGYADGELDVVRAMDVERHIHDCPACGRAFQCLRGLRDVVAEAPLYRRAPPALERRVRAALWAEAGLAESHETHGARRDDSHKASLETTPVRRFTLAGWRRVALAASVLLAVALAAAVGWRMARGPMGPPEQAVAREVVAGHVRSLLAEHLLDVPSSDRHTVRPWFNGKLDFAPDVRDFAADGYPLAGGRLDYLDGRPVAALVYRHGRHPINLFTWPAGGAAGDGAAGPERLLTVNGYRVAHWTAGAMTYWAVSDTGEDEMRQFVRLVRDSH
jgi:anti-sigma factor RsiW